MNCETFIHLRRPAVAFPTDMPGIQQRLKTVNPVKYAQTRNYTNGAVTYLSPYISRGVISLCDVREQLLQSDYSQHSLSKILQELSWREYFQRVWQHVGDRIWQSLKTVQHKANFHHLPDSILQGCNGIHAIDEAIALLKVSGYMHNHVRMYLASLLCNIAQTHWQEPARWLYHFLLDGDIASNNCSWQWVAGAFSSKAYYFNQENLNRFTGSTQTRSFLDCSYDVIKEMEVPKVFHHRSPLQLATNLPETSVAQIDTNKPTLIYNSYNLDPHWRNCEDVNRICLLEPSHFEKYPVSKKVLEFIIDLTKNIPTINVVVGEVDEISQLYLAAGKNGKDAIISKEHPAFSHYPGLKDEREWLYPEVTGFYPSFSSYYKHCQKMLR